MVYEDPEIHVAPVGHPVDLFATHFFNSVVSM